MVSGVVEIRLLSTGVPSMMKMAVAPVSTIACKISFGRLCPGAPKRVRAVAANVCCWTGWLDVAVVFFTRVQASSVVFDIIIVMALLSTSAGVLLIWAGVREITNAQFTLSATYISAPPCQNPAFPASN